MRVLVAGASGVIGRQLVPLLGSVGHDVIALSRTQRRAAAAAAGVSVVAADALDATAMTRVMRQTAPDAVVNLLTAIPASIDPKHFARDFAQTNVLRTHGTRNLLDAADDIGVGLIVSESLAFAYDPRETTLADEDTSLWVDPPTPFAPARDALVELEQRTRASGGLVLRFGHLYGPGTSYAADGSFTDQVRRRKVPVVGGGKATFSFIHTHDAATAILAALDRRTGGTLNIVDDDPAPVREWLPYLAEVLGAPAPRSAPAVLARLAAGAWGVAFITRLRGADNARARLVLDWRPRYTSWRDGFTAELGARAAAASGASRPGPGDRL
jgi:nucleoside-diphosphate-sugar epimerase